MKKQQDKPHKLSFSFPKESVSQEAFFDAINAAFKAEFGEVPDNVAWKRAAESLTDKKRLPAKEDGEKDDQYFFRLRDMWGQADMVKETHERWKSKHRNGVFKRDYRQRIITQLQELFLSDFLCYDYIDTGMPREDREQAVCIMKKEGLEVLLEETDGADWKFAMLTRHLMKPQEQKLLCDAYYVGEYIADMRERLTWVDLEAFLRFDTFMWLVYEDMGAFEDEEEKEENEEEEDEEEEDHVEEEWNDELDGVFNSSINPQRVFETIKAMSDPRVTDDYPRFFVFFRVLLYIGWIESRPGLFLKWANCHWNCGWLHKHNFKFSNNIDKGLRDAQISQWNANTCTSDIGNAYRALAKDVLLKFTENVNGGKLIDRIDFYKSDVKARINDGRSLAYPF